VLAALVKKELMIKFPMFMCEIAHSQRLKMEHESRQFRWV